jgi:hypothetical protein
MLSDGRFPLFEDISRRTQYSHYGILTCTMMNCENIENYQPDPATSGKIPLAKST